MNPINPGASAHGKAQPIGVAYRNAVLDGLGANDAAALHQYLEDVPLPSGLTMERVGEKPRHMFFPTSGLIGMSAGPRGRKVEITLIGANGMTAAPALLGDTLSTHDAVVHVAGSGWRIAFDRVENAVGTSPGVRDAMQSYLKSYLAEIVETAVVNAKGSIEERVARRLAQSFDLLGTSQLTITHDELAYALGVRRPSVTLSLQALEGKHLVRAKRRSIELTDRDALSAFVSEACGRRMASPGHG